MPSENPGKVISVSGNMDGLFSINIHTLTCQVIGFLVSILDKFHRLNLNMMVKNLR